MKDLFNAPKIGLNRLVNRAEGPLSVLIWFLFFQLGPVQLAQATDYYVNPTSTGQDRTDADWGKSPSKPWKTLNFAFTTVSADAGHTINLSSFTYTVGFSELKSGVNLKGAGINSTFIKVNQGFDLTTDPVSSACSAFYKSHPEKFAIQLNGLHQNQRLEGFTIDGNNKQGHGAIYAEAINNVVFANIKFVNFKFTGLWIPKSDASTVQGCTFQNCAWANSKREMGNLMFFDARGLKILNNTITQTPYNGYGIKVLSRRRADNCDNIFQGPDIEALSQNVEIAGNSIDVLDLSLYVVNANGDKAPEISIEILYTSITGFNIHDNTVNNHISVVSNYNRLSGSTNAGQPTAPMDKRSVWIHNNTFNLGGDNTQYRYAVEANTPNMEFSYNFINGGYYGGLGQFQAERSNWTNTDRGIYQLIHHNIFYANIGAFLNYDRFPYGLRVYNNTVVDTKGISALFKQTSATPAQDAEIINNIFFSTLDVRGDLFDETKFNSPKIANNLFYHINTFGNNAKYVDPGKYKETILNFVGNKPDPYFKLPAGSPAINAGVPITLVTKYRSGELITPANDANPNIGRYDTDSPGGRQAAVEEQVGESAVWVYPNPVENQVIHLKVKGVQASQITLWNEAGKPQPIKQNSETDGTITLTPEQRLPTGVYLLILQTSGGLQTRKVIFN